MLVSVFLSRFMSVRVPVVLMAFVTTTWFAPQIGRSDLRGWDGSENTNFENDDNWVMGAPADDMSSDVAYFFDPLVPNQPALTKDRSIGGFLFEKSGCVIAGDGFAITIGNSGVSSTTSGLNTIAARILGTASCVITSSGPLVLGDASSSSGFATEGTLTVDDQTFTLHDSDAAELGAMTTLAGGVLIAPNGIVLDGSDSLTGFGIVRGAIIDNTGGGAVVPSGGVFSLPPEFNPLHVGTETINLIGQLIKLPDTTISGGTVAAPGAGVVNMDPDKTITGSGQLRIDIQAFGGMFGTPTITANGDLTMGTSVSGFTTFREGVLNVGEHNVAIEGAANLIETAINIGAGSLMLDTDFSGGSNEFTDASFTLGDGRFDGGPASWGTIAGATITGRGLVRAASNIGAMPFVTTSPTGTLADITENLDVGNDGVRILSDAPVGLGPETTLAGGRLQAENGMVLEGSDTISGFGFIFGTITDNTSGAGGLNPTGTLAVNPLNSFVPPTGDTTILSDVREPLRINAQNPQSTIVAPNGLRPSVGISGTNAITLRADVLFEPEIVNIGPALRIEGPVDVNGADVISPNSTIEVQGDVVLGGGQISSTQLDISGTLLGSGFISGPFTASQVIPQGVPTTVLGTNELIGRNGLLTIIADDVYTIPEILNLNGVEVVAPSGVVFDNTTIVSSSGVNSVPFNPAGTVLGIQVFAPSELEIGDPVNPGPLQFPQAALGQFYVVPSLTSRSRIHTDSEAVFRLCELFGSATLDVPTGVSTPFFAIIDAQFGIATVTGPIRGGDGSRYGANGNVDLVSIDMETSRVRGMHFFSGENGQPATLGRDVKAHGTIVAANGVRMRTADQLDDEFAVLPLTIFGPLRMDGLSIKQGETTIHGLLTGTGEFQGPLMVTGGATFEGYFVDALFGGDPTFVPREVVIADGGINPGDVSTPGLLLTGDLTLSDDPTITIEIGGTIIGLQYDGLEARGAISLDSSVLDVRLIDCFRPHPADTFVILTAADIIGSFANAPPNGGGVGLIAFADGSFDVMYSATSIELTNFQPAASSDGDTVPDICDNCVAVMNLDQRDTNSDGIGNACDPDLNNDCIVGMADLAKLLACFGAQSGDAAFDADCDLDGDGVVGPSDVHLSFARFGEPPGPSADGSCPL